MAPRIRKLSARELLLKKKIENKNKDKRMKTLRGAQISVKVPFKKATNEYPDFIGKCPKCFTKTPFGRMPKWDNNLAKQWVRTKSFLKRYDEWHNVSVCDECYNLMLEGCRLNRTGETGNNNLHKRMLK